MDKVFDSFINLRDKGFTIIPLIPKMQSLPKGRNAKEFEGREAIDEEITLWVKMGWTPGILLERGYVLLDFDNVELFEAAFPEGYPTYTLRTPQGYHLLFKGTGEEKAKSLYLNDGRDAVTLKRAGITAGEGHIHPSGEAYILLKDVPPAEFPGWEWAEKKIKAAAKELAIEVSSAPPAVKAVKSQDNKEAKEVKSNYNLCGWLQAVARDVYVGDPRWKGRTDLAAFMFQSRKKEFNGDIEKAIEVLLHDFALFPLKKFDEATTETQVRHIVEKGLMPRGCKKIREETAPEECNHCSCRSNPLTITEEYHIPEKFSMSYKGPIFSIREDKEGKENRTNISNSPIWVRGRAWNIDTQEVFLTLEWADATGKRHRELFPQGKLYQKRGLIEVLPKKGVEVIDANAGSIVKFILDSVKANISTIRKFNTSEKFGWKPGKVFILGEKSYTENRIEKIKILNDMPVAESIKERGTAEGWCRGMEELLHYPRALFKVYAACAAPLLKILNVKSFLIDDYGESTTGKTRTAEVAMSVWGDPLRLALTAYATKVGIERYTSIFSDLPILLDETSTVPEKVLKDVLYMLANEIGKLRGKKEGGLQETPTWKTIAFFTGEASITNEKSFQGQRVRVIELYGGLDADAPEAIETAATTFKENYGVMGPLVIQKIFKEWDELLPLFLDGKRKLRENVNGSAGYASRISERFAAIMAGAYIFESVWEDLGFPPHDSKAAIFAVFKDTLDLLNQTNYTDRGRDYVKSWIYSNWDFFLQTSESEEERERRGGKFEIKGQVTDNYINVYPNVLSETMVKGGYDYGRLLKDFKRDGTIVANKGKLQKSIRIDGNIIKVISFVREKLDEEEEN